MMSGRLEASFAELIVCFDLPADDVASNALILSFVPPHLEAAAQLRFGARLINGRALVQETRPRARAAYIRLIAQIGATPCFGGKTLREILVGPGGYSRWWLLDITERDCLWDGDPLYATMLQAVAVQSIRARHGIDRVRVHGDARALEAAVGRGSAAYLRKGSLSRIVIAGLAGRLKLLAESVSTWWALRCAPRVSADHRDVLLQGSWDWTVRPDGAGGLKDRYFTDLPEQLARRGVRVGWLTTCEPFMEPWQRGRRKQDVFAAASAHPEVTLLERYLTAGDVARAIFNLRYPVRVVRAVSNRAFQQLCVVDGINMYPLVWRQLVRAVCVPTFCRLQLVATATARACQRIRPGVFLGGLELFLRSRALYAGVRASGGATRIWAAQHAGYSTDKTMGVFDPDVEIGGAPDGFPVPQPDGIFLLGELSRRIWAENGFTGSRALLTGGLRYQHIRIESRATEALQRPVTLLLAGGMCEAAHVDLCDAAIAAAAGLPIRLVWRDHPSYLFTRRPAFRQFRGAIEVTSGTLDNDLQNAALVMFSQTGIAEEALLRGIPVWQWLWPGFNTSPFLDVPLIPAFTSVRDLRRELEGFLKEPARYSPTRATQERVLSECFGPHPARASAMIGDAVRAMVGAPDL